jgi:prepilin-type N-terminal cleavage/methylation domain-containing protein
MRRQRKGFTLVEVLAVLVIISLLMVIAVPTTMTVSKKIKNKMLSNKMELAQKAALLWADDNINCLLASNCVAFTTDTNGVPNLECGDPDDLSIKKCNITINQLAKDNYFEYDDQNNNIVLNPVDKSSLNTQVVTFKVNINNKAVNVNPIEVTVAKPKSIITVTGINCDKLYDGTNQSCPEPSYLVTYQDSDKKDISTLAGAKIDTSNISYHYEQDNRVNFGKYKYSISGMKVVDATDTSKDISRKYQIVYVDGSLNIKPIELKVNVSNCSVNYSGIDQQCPLSNIHISGNLATGEKLINSTEIPTGTYVKTYTKDVKLNVVDSVGNDTTDNYNITSNVKLSLVINKLPIVITANSCSYKTNGSNQTCSGITYQVNNKSGILAANNSIELLSNGDTLRDNGSAISNSKAGTYIVPVNISIINNETNVESNYYINKTNGNLVLTDKSLYSSSVTVEDSGLSSSNVNNLTKYIGEDLNSILNKTSYSGSITSALVNGKSIIYSGTTESYDAATGDNEKVTTTPSSKSATLMKGDCNEYDCPNGGELKGKICGPLTLVADPSKNIQQVISSTEFTVKGSCDCEYSTGEKKWYTPPKTCSNVVCLDYKNYKRTKTSVFDAKYSYGTDSTSTYPDTKEGRTSAGEEGCIAYKYVMGKTEGVPIWGLCTWQGDLPASCSSYNPPYYKCGSGETLVGSSCYYCPDDYNFADGTCVKYTPVYTTKYKYKYTIYYDYWK